MKACDRQHLRLLLSLLLSLDPFSVFFSFCLLLLGGKGIEEILWTTVGHVFYICSSVSNTVPSAGRPPKLADIQMNMIRSAASD